MEVPVGQLAETMQRDLIFGGGKPRAETARDRLDSESSASARNDAGATAAGDGGDYAAGQSHANAVAE